MAKKKTPRQKAIDRADKYFSIYIRTKYADARGWTKCHSCGVEKHWKELDCGHFKSRTYKSTRWDERNALPQCKRCNMLGEQYMLGKSINEIFGEGTAEYLDSYCHTLSKFTTAEINEIADKYRELCKK